MRRHELRSIVANNGMCREGSDRCLAIATLRQESLTEELGTDGRVGECERALPSSSSSHLYLDIRINHEDGFAHRQCLPLRVVGTCARCGPLKHNTPLQEQPSSHIRRKLKYLVPPPTSSHASDPSSWSKVTIVGFEQHLLVRREVSSPPRCLAKRSTSMPTSCRHFIKMLAENTAMQILMACHTFQAGVQKNTWS